MKIRLLPCVALLFFMSVQRTPADQPLPEDPRAGARLFQEKSCAYCHSVGEQEEKIGPNLARVHERGSLLDVAGDIWNHAPTMMDKMQELRITWPKVTGREMANLVAFLSANQYYLENLGKAGDPGKGSRVFEEKNCSKCHSLQREADFEKIGPSLRGYTQLSPVQVAQAMWNHGPAMAEEFQKLGISRPKFEGAEISDLIAYLQQTASPAESQPSYVEPGSPNRGRALFEQKGCAGCHPVRGIGGSPDIPDLGRRREELVRSATDVAGIMWNHGSAMWEKMQQKHLPVSKFEDNEMADIIAYLYFINYFDRPGDRKHGKELFIQKRCAECHDVTGQEKSTGPDLTKSSAVGSPIDTIAAMWDHAPEIEKAMRSKGVPWPDFEPGEIVDLMEYLQSLQNGGA